MKYVKVLYRSEHCLKCIDCDKIMESVENADICLGCGLSIGTCPKCQKHTSKLLKWNKDSEEFYPPYIPGEYIDDTTMWTFKCRCNAIFEANCD